MNRRNVLRYTAYTVTGAALYPLIQGCKEATAVEGFAPSFFDTDQYTILQDICDILIPETDTPGAISLGVPEFFDHMVDKVFPAEAKEGFQSDFIELTKSLDERASGKSFSKLSKSEKTDLITKLDKAWYNSDDNSDAKAAYMGVRGQVIGYYLSTEYVGTNLTEYLPVPGAYEGCTDLTVTGNKAWTI